MEAFRGLVASFGTLLEVDPGKVNWEKFEFAWLMVEMEDGRTVLEFVKVHWGDNRLCISLAIEDPVLRADN